MRLSSVLSHGAVIFLFVIVSAVDAQSSLNYRLSKDLTPSVYDLHITIDLASLKFDGIETIHVHAHQPSSTIELHVLDLSLLDVQVIDGQSLIPIIASAYNNRTQTFKISLSRSLIADRDYEIKLKFEGEIKDDMKGLYRSSYYENRVVKYMATTFSAAAYARKIFPCFDEPAFKAVFNLAVTNRNNFVALANEDVKSIVTSEINGLVWRTTEFNPSPVMSTYLLAFAVSEFRNVTQLTSNEQSVVFSVRSSQKTISSMRYALDTGIEALAAIEAYLGHNYTLGKMDFIAIDDFLMGAMENWGLVSFKSSRIMNPVGQRSRRKVQEITNIITHELVHMFFGNQVTCAYWDYVWLNEGFASYLEYVIADKLLPNWNVLDYFVVNRMHAAMLQDVKPKTHAMTRAINTPDEISRIYDFVAYPKAASVIRMIEHIMTPEIFQKSLELYIRERSFKSSTDEQLYEVLERTRPEYSKSTYPPIPDVFRSWSNNPGYPILNVHFEHNETVLISQELFVPFINRTEPSEFYILYNFVTSFGGRRFGNTSVMNWFQTPTAEFRIPAIDYHHIPGWVIFNVQQTGYYRVNYDERNWNLIIEELNGASFDAIHKLNRAQLLDDSFNLARHDYLNFRTALDLMKYLRQETELIPLIAGFKSIEFLLTFLDQVDFYVDLRDMLLNLVDEIYVRINNSSLPLTAEDEDYHALTKLHVNSFACKIGAQSCLKNAQTKLFLFELSLEWNQLDVEERPYYYCGALYNDLASFNWKQLETKLLKGNQDEEFYRENQDEFNEIFEAFSTCDSNLERIEKLLRNIFNNDDEIPFYKIVSKENALQVVKNLIKVGTNHRSLMLTFFLENFITVNAKAPFKETLSTFGEAINTQAHLERFISLANTAGLDVNETIADIEENIRWMMVKAPEIGIWVNGALRAKLSLLATVTLIFAFALK